MNTAERDSGSSWTVYRQDDTGNRFVVRTGLPHEDASKLAAELEARGHKQLYWVEADGTTIERSSDQRDEV